MQPIVDSSLNSSLRSNIPSNSPIVHIMSASCAGFVAATVTNPIWLVKTRLQLDHQRGEGLSVRNCVTNIYNHSGLRGFYKGITASYMGISETVIHFVIYEALKAKLVSTNEQGRRGASELIVGTNCSRLR